MIKEFFIDERKKKKLQNYMRNSTDKYSGIKKAIRVLNFLVIILPVSFLIYAYFISDGFVQLHSRYAPAGTKNHLFIITVSIVIFVLMLFFKFIMNTIYTGLAERNIKGRFAETLIYNNGVLEYGYKNYMQATMFDRVIVKIPLSAMEKVICNADENKITFEGPISNLYYDNYSRDITRGQEKFENGVFELWDYFSPSLKEFLSENNMEIIEK